MHGSNFLPVMFSGKIKSELGDPLALMACHNFKALNHSRNQLMFETGIFAFRLLSNNNKIEILIVSSLNPFQALEIH